MKRWIHAKTDEKKDIEQKIKDYIAAWAEDDCKDGNPVATYDEFEDEFEAKGWKADRDKYDYYIACYNSACGK